MFMNMATAPPRATAGCLWKLLTGGMFPLYPGRGNWREYCTCCSSERCWHRAKSNLKMPNQYKQIKNALPIQIILLIATESPQFWKKSRQRRQGISFKNKKTKFMSYSDAAHLLKLEPRSTKPLDPKLSDITVCQPERKWDLLGLCKDYLHEPGSSVCVCVCPCATLPGASAFAYCLTKQEIIFRERGALLFFSLDSTQKKLE